MAQYIKGLSLTDGKSSTNHGQPTLGGILTGAVARPCLADTWTKANPGPVRSENGHRA